MTTGSLTDRPSRGRGEMPATAPLSNVPSDTVRYGQAALIESDTLARILNFIRIRSRTVDLDELKVLLSMRAGLRASEIAALEVRSLLTADGKIAGMIYICGKNAKYRRGRTIPMHRDIHAAFRRYRSIYPDAKRIAFPTQMKPYQKQDANSVAVWFHRLYRDVGLINCSSHSGRRTFITELARKANTLNRSLRDVQLLAGHARLETTERYIEHAGNNFDFVASL